MLGWRGSPAIQRPESTVAVVNDHVKTLVYEKSISGVAGKLAPQNEF
jgi:hypothetical protein